MAFLRVDAQRAECSRMATGGQSFAAYTLRPSTRNTFSTVPDRVSVAYLILATHNQREASPMNNDIE